MQPPSPRRSEADGTGSKDQRQQQQDEGEHHLTETPSGAAPAASEIHLDGHSASAVPDNVDNVLNPTPYHPDHSPHSHSPSICTEASFAPAAHHPSPTSVGLNGTANHRTPDHYPCDDPPGQPYMHSSPEEFVVNELTALRDLSGNTAPFAPPSSEPYPTIASPLFDHSVFSDPANFTDNIFVPGSAYEALHTALRNRQLWTARPDIPSRTESPVSVPGYGVAIDGIRPDAGRHHHRQQPSRGFELSPDRENVLWQNYLNEICLWVGALFSWTCTRWFSLVLTMHSSTCSTAIGTSPRRFRRWQSPRRTCDTPSWRCLRDRSSGSRMKSPSRKVSRCTKRQSISSYQS